MDASEAIVKALTMAAMSGEQKSILTWAGNVSCAMLCQAFAGRGAEMQQQPGGPQIADQGCGWETLFASPTTPRAASAG